MYFSSKTPFESFSSNKRNVFLVERHVSPYIGWLSVARGSSVRTDGPPNGQDGLPNGPDGPPNGPDSPPNGPDGPPAPTVVPNQRMDNVTPIFVIWDQYSLG